MNQMFGSVKPRCISFDNSGFPLAVWLPAITQLFEPDAHFSQSGKPIDVRRSRHSPAEIGAAPACELSSSSSLLGVAGGGRCGCVRSITAPVGGRSRHEPTGYKSPSSLALCSFSET